MAVRVGAIDILLTDRVDVPFSTRESCAGAISSYHRRLLSQSDDLRIAVAHELQHMRQGDLGWEVAAELLRPLFFWNPAFSYLKREVEELRELACDQQVLARRQYRRARLLRLPVCGSARTLWGQNGVARQIVVPTVPLVRPADGRRAARFLKQRVLSMTAHSGILTPSRWATGLMVLPFAAVISFGSIASQSSNADWSQDRLMLSTIVNLERLDQRTLATRY